MQSIYFIRLYSEASNMNYKYFLRQFIYLFILRKLIYLCIIKQSNDYT